MNVWTNLILVRSGRPEFRTNILGHLMALSEFLDIQGNTLTI